MVGSTRSTRDTRGLAGRPPDERAGAYCRAAGLLGCRPEKTAMVGDQLEWDVVGPLRAGYHLAILVGGPPATLPRGAVQVQALNEVTGRLLDAAPHAKR